MNFKKTFIKLFSVLALIQSMAFSAYAETTQEERRKIFKECAAEVGMPEPQKGERPQRPDPEIKAKLDACLESKGLTPPKDFGGGGGGGRPPGPPPSEGVR